MKPPHGNRPGGSSRPPSDRGPSRGPGGGSSRPSGPGAGPRSESRFGGQNDQRPRSESRFGGQGDQRPRSEGPRSDGPRSDGPRSERPRSEGPRSGAPRSGGKSSFGGKPAFGGGKPSFGGAKRGDSKRSAPSRNDASRSDTPRTERPRAERPYADRPREYQARDERPRTERPYEGRPANDRQRDVRPRDVHPEEELLLGDDGPYEAPLREERPREAKRGFSSGPRQHNDAPRATPDAPKGTVWLYGTHAVAAALANPNRRIRRLLLTEEAEASIAKQLPQPWSMMPEQVERSRLDNLLGRDAVHQGAALLADPLAPPSLQSVLEKEGVIIVLDQVTDPRNVGAIMRTAAAFGAAAVITQDRNSPEETGGLAKAASGALETVPLLRAVNIARTIIALKAANVWCVGLDAGGKALDGADFAGRRVALVLGAEGEGLRRLTRETCDEVAGLSMSGPMESLNVSAAASVALYELTRR